MRVLILRLLVLAGVGATGMASAQQGAVLPPADALAALQRIASAARQMSYSGTFVYQQGELVETARIAHVVEGGHELERLETLDGPRREIVRKGDLVVTYNPDTKLMRVDRRRPGRFFPQILPDQLANVTDHYRVRRGDVERVANHDAQVLMLEPKDDKRYGHQFWAEVGTGLLLKAKMLGERNTVVEQFAFTQVQIGGPVPKDALTPSFSIAEPLSAPPPPLPLPDAAWEIRQAPAGFRKVVELKRSREGSGSPSITHMVLTDGLTAISVFIEPARAGSEPDRHVQKGSVNIYTRLMDGYRVTVVGEAPAVTVQAIASSVSARPK